MSLPFFRTFIGSLFACVACGRASGGVPLDGGSDGSIAVESSVTDAPTGPRANGSVGEWMRAPDLPIARANHCSIAIGTTVYVVGGNYRGGSGFVTVDSIEASDFSGEFPTPWRTVGRAPAPVRQCTLISGSNQISIIDGIWEGDAVDRTKIWSASITGATHAERAVGSFVPIGNRLEGYTSYSGEALVRDGHWYVTSSRLADPGAIVLLHAVTDGNTIGTWEVLEWGLPWRSYPSYAFTPTHAYVFGGYPGGTGSQPPPRSFAAPILDNGALGTAVETTQIPEPLGNGRAVAIDGYVFVVGGRPTTGGAAAVTSVYSAPIGPDGMLGRFTPQMPMPGPRVNFSLAVVGSWLVISGGANEGPGDTVAYYAQVRFP